MTVRRSERDGSLSAQRLKQLNNMPAAIYKQPRSLIKHSRQWDPLACRLNRIAAATKNHVVRWMTSSRDSNYI
ncbi:Uncharacterized protein DAT39_006718 [Clarias magur]|uniref:Uncharacterized protein n=1 Tax=Clarias magur TaxID=1594786 RepID=A0A8J4UTZ9_CLAMG|nr:Uncharacterized protein DAT39_006718 [Clarias magur]